MRNNPYGGVAQRLERFPVTEEAAGSNPVTPAKNIISFLRYNLSVLNKKFLKGSDLKNIRKKFIDKKIVFTYGTFDLVHGGHAAFLAGAKLHGDLLIVGIANNKSKRRLRGPGFPIVDELNRAEIVSYFLFVDYVCFIDESDITKLLTNLKPDIFYTLTTDWKSHLRKSCELEIVKKYDGIVVKVKPSEPYVSSSDIVERAADLKIKEIVEYFFGKITIDLKNGNWSQKKFSGLKTNVRDNCLHFGNHVGRLGIGGAKFASKLISENDILKIKKKFPAKKIVLTSGSCDLLHAGHLRFYSKAKENGDILILGLPCDKVITKQKGRGRPSVSEYSRAELMTFFDFIDYVFIFTKDSVEPYIETLKPDVFFTVAEEWNDVRNHPIDKKIKEYGGKVVLCPPQSSGISSSKLIKKVAGIRVREIFKEVLNEAEKFTSLKDA